MASSAFRSTTKRTPIGPSASASSSDDSSFSNRTSAHRRSRSLSRFSRRLPEPEIPFPDDAPAPRGRFVNSIRGSGFPEISLDDLSVELFSSGDRGRRSGARNAVDRPGGNGENLSQRRGRSVSRQSLRTVGGCGDRRSSVCNTFGEGRTASENHSRRRRSVSVVRCPISDSESDLDCSCNSSSHANLKNFNYGSNQRLPSRKPVTAPQRQGLTRSLSQKDFKYYDGDSSQSSALTDDEVRDNQFTNDGIERTIRAVYSQRKAEHPTGDDRNGELYEVMRKELRHAVEEIRTEIEHVMSRGVSDPATDNAFSSKNQDIRKAGSSIRRNYSNKLEQSKRHEQHLSGEIVMELRRGRELSQIVKDSPEPNANITANPSQAKRRSNDRSRMSKRLSEEAEKYIEDFISNVEDTDISSVDGERSDTSSALGGIMKVDTFQSPASTKPLSSEMDGVMLPWLQWETTNDVSPQSSCKKIDSPVTPVSSMWGAAQEANDGRDLSGYSMSSHGSWNPEALCATTSITFKETKILPDPSHLTSSGNVDEYVMAVSDEDLLFEVWSQKQRISSAHDGLSQRSRSVISGSVEFGKKPLDLDLQPLTAQR